MDELSENWLGHTPIAFKDVAGSGKSFVGFDQVDIDRATAYAAEDADVTLRLWQVLKPRLAARAWSRVYERLERPLVPVLARMEQRGISVDRQILSRLSGELAQGAARARGRDLRAGRRALQHRLAQAARRHPVRQHGPARRPQDQDRAVVDPAQVLEDLAAEGHELPRKIVDWRQLTKLKSTYTDALPGYINPETGRVHTSYALAATTTGPAVLVRAEPAEHPDPHRGGPQDPHRLHRRQGQQADLGRLQPDRAARARPCRRHPAAQAGLRRRRRHPRHDGVRNVRRAGRRHAGGGAPPRQGDQFRHHLRHLRLRPRQPAVDPARGGGRLHQEATSSASPASATTWRTTKAFARENGYVETIFGRRIHYPEIRSSNPSVRAFNERASINAPIQGTAADIIRRAMIRMDDALAEAGLSARMLLQVHDELIFETAEAEVEATIPVVRHVMENAAMPARLDVGAAAGRRPRRRQLGRGALRCRFASRLVGHAGVISFALTALILSN